GAPDLRPARPPAAGPRARGGAREGAQPGADPRAARAAAAAPHRRAARRSGAAADAAGDDRVELRPPLTGRADAVPAARGLFRWLHAGGGGGDLRRRPRFGPVARRQEPAPLRRGALPDA